MKPFSEATGAAIDLEVRQLAEHAYQRALALIEEKKDVVSALATKLLAEETLNHDQLITVLGPRPFSSDAYTTFLEHHGELAPKLAIDPSNLGPPSENTATKETPIAKSSTTE